MGKSFLQTSFLTCGLNLTNLSISAKKKKRKFIYEDVGGIHDLNRLSSDQTVQKCPVNILRV